jgi:hypothetical protein
VYSEIIFTSLGLLTSIIIIPFFLFEAPSLPIIQILPSSETLTSLTMPPHLINVLQKIYYVSLPTLKDNLKFVVFELGYCGQPRRILDYPLALGG